MRIDRDVLSFIPESGKTRENDGFHSEHELWARSLVEARPQQVAVSSFHDGRLLDMPIVEERQLLETPREAIHCSFGTLFDYARLKASDVRCHEQAFNSLRSQR